MRKFFSKNLGCSTTKSEETLTNEKDKKEMFRNFRENHVVFFLPAMWMEIRNTCSQLISHFCRERILSDPNWSAHFNRKREGFGVGYWTTIMDYSLQQNGFLTKLRWSTWSNKRCQKELDLQEASGKVIISHSHGEPPFFYKSIINGDFPWVF